MKGGIGTVVIVGLVVWWLTQQKQAQAAGMPAGKMSEYERLRTYVPITASTERWFEVYGED